MVVADQKEDMVALPWKDLECRVAMEDIEYNKDKAVQIEAIDLINF
jgi:hypothetical protein